MSRLTRVLFVCLGNICRSPTAEGVFTTLAAQRGVRETLEIDSCGTSDWHIGKAPDERAIRVAAARGFPIAHLRARQIQASDFEHYDYILAMDKANLKDLQALCPSGFSGYLGLFLTLAPELGIEELPDPYYGDAQAFEQVLDLSQVASEKLLQLVCIEEFQRNAGTAE